MYGLIVILSLWIALRTHPDKDLDNPEATREFQRVSDACNTLNQHLDSDNLHDYDDYSDVKDYSDDETRMVFYVICSYVNSLTSLSLYSDSSIFFGFYSKSSNVCMFGSIKETSTHRLPIVGVLPLSVRRIRAA